MIIRHDIAPTLYLADAKQFSAVVVVDSHLEEVLVGYDNIDQLLKPNLLPSVQAAPEFTLCADGMGCLIRPDWILTAAHVVEGLSEGHEIQIGGSAYGVRRVVLHPDFVNAEEMAQVRCDIALIQLMKSVAAIAPLSLYSQPDELHKIATFVGSGDFGNGLIGPDSADGKLRKATNRIDEMDEEWLVCKFDAPPECTALEGVSGPGDRGGPALLKVGDEWAIAGISVGQNSPEKVGEGRYGGWEYYTRVYHYLAWIESVVD
ncbi:MAG: trypsin-like serine protease [Phormidesmis sp.]